MVGDFALVEEAGQVGLHFGLAGDAHPHREEPPQVVLHQGALAVARQTLLPALTAALVTLLQNTWLTLEFASSVTSQNPTPSNS